MRQNPRLQETVRESHPEVGAPLAGGAVRPNGDLVEVPGESRTGLYDTGTGELIPDERGR